jgi:hypothetical protein
VSRFTQPIFIVSSGRSGTAMLHKVLSAAGVDMHHEYMVHIVQPLGVKRYQGWIDGAAAQATLRQTHAAAVHYSRASHWGDSSNKLSWLIPDLAAVLPSAKFVHLVRDGRKVVSSYFHKLSDECYDDASSAALLAYARNTVTIAPPPEKKYWWPLPRNGDPRAREWDSFGQFERICWHWSEINRTILAALRNLPGDRQLFMTLEQLEASSRQLQTLFAFLGLAYEARHHALFARPHNVNRPEDHLLNAQQTECFMRIAGPMLERLGYADRPEYVVNY